MKDRECRYAKDKEKHKNAEELAFVCVMPRQPRTPTLQKKKYPCLSAECIQAFEKAEDR